MNGPVCWYGHVADMIDDARHEAGLPPLDDNVGQVPIGRPYVVAAADAAVPRGPFPTLPSAEEHYRNTRELPCGYCDRPHRDRTCPGCGAPRSDLDLIRLR